ncbi:MAG: Swt1 family HEPN domain-containing protein [Acidobacteria bacterium]|nr:Swt1 family HEPN domain-containing protein [Acidobacteriota bacterium]
MRLTLGEFMFSGLRTAHALKDMESSGQLAPPLRVRSQDSTVSLFAPATTAIRVASAKMQKSYRVMFVLENLVRELVVEEMTEQFGVDWFDKKATSPMKKKYADRVKQEKKNRWHESVETDPIYYLDFGDLSRIIRNHWTVFKELFPDQAWVENKMAEAERCRNVVAHSKQLRSEDQSRLEMHLRDWIKQVC